MEVNKLQKILVKPKSTRLIYVIDTKHSREELERIISECEIDFFSIDTQCFANKRDYKEMIINIKEITQELNHPIGIIAELAGRKIKVEAIKLGNQSNAQESYQLKKGDRIKVYSNPNSKAFHKNIQPENIFDHDKQIIVNFKDIHRLVKKNDSIIINDNKGELKVLEIREKLHRTQTAINIPIKAIQFRNSQIIPYNTLRHLSNLDVRVQEIINEDDISLSHAIRKKSTSDCYLQEVVNSAVAKGVRVDEEIKTQNLAKQIKKITFKSEESLSSFTSGERDIEDYKKGYEDYPDNTIFPGDEITREKLMREENASFLKNTARRHTVFIDTTTNESSKQVSSSDLTSSHRTVMSLNSSPVLRASEFECRRSLLRKSTCNKKCMEIICEVKYDCTINRNSVLFVPNVDYTTLGIDILTNTEVREINELDQLGIDFICIGIKSMKDIESIREVNSNINIIASLPDYNALACLDEILKETSGVLLSRTFQILNEKTKNSITRLTKNVIQTCRASGKPVFSFIDIREDFLVCRRRRKSHVNDIMHNIIDGMDGFFLNVLNSQGCRVNAINYFVDYFKNIHQDKHVIHEEHCADAQM